MPSPDRRLPVCPANMVDVSGDVSKNEPLLAPVVVVHPPCVVLSDTATPAHVPFEQVGLTEESDVNVEVGAWNDAVVLPLRVKPLIVADGGGGTTVAENNSVG